MPNPDDSGEQYQTSTTVGLPSQDSPFTTDVGSPPHSPAGPSDAAGSTLISSETQPSTMRTIYSSPPTEWTMPSATVSSEASYTTQTELGSGTLPSPGTTYESTAETAGSPPNSLASTETPDVTSKAGPVVVIGTETLTLPEIISSTTFTTIDHTFTIAPPDEGGFTQYPTIVVIGSETATLPPVSEATTMVTLDSTFTLLPPTSPSDTSVSRSSDGTTTPTSPNTSHTTHAPTAPQSTASMPPETTGPAINPSFSIQPSLLPTKPGANSTESVIAIIGTETLHLPRVTLDSTITTKGRTITLVSGGPPTITIVEPSEEPSPTGTSSTADFATFTTWPPQALITPVEISVKKPEPSEDEESSVIPCDLWFFSICIRFDDINILGWKVILPPGIYPPNLKLDQIIKLPQSIVIHGELPPWPKFTVGQDHVPTFPSEPEPTKCETKTASLCATATPVVVSTIEGQLRTLTTGAPTSTCAEMRGCLVADSTHEATITKTAECETATATDIVVTCSGSGTTACLTKTGLPKTGCDVTATTTTVSCTPVPTGGQRRQAIEGAAPACPMTDKYIVWPQDGTRTDDTSTILIEIQRILSSDAEIVASDTKDLGVNFWRVLMDSDQADEVRHIANVASVYRECTSECSDPTMQDSKISWRYQSQYLDEQIYATNHMKQMAYISANKGSDNKRYNEHYYFDISAGEDIPVYIVDTGAQMDHIEFTLRDNIASKTEFIFVGEDIDGQQNRDDSNIQQNGECASPVHCKAHGTAMLSIIAGANIGIAKKVKPIMVRVPRRQKKGGGASPEQWLSALSAVDDAIPDKSGTTRAILCMAQGHQSEDFRRDWVKKNKEKVQDAEKEAFEQWARFRLRMHRILTSLIAKGVFIVTGSGNAFVLNTLPAEFAPEHQKDYSLSIPELLVVGAADISDGSRWWKSGLGTAGVPHIYAPGEKLIVAEGNKAAWPGRAEDNDKPTQRRQTGDKKSFYKFSQGTSDATAYTAGLAAYFLKLHQLGRLGPDAKGNPPDMSPAGLKRYIINNGWVRQNEDNNGVLGIWNGATIESLEREGFCPYIAGTTNIFRLRRQEDAALTGQCVPGTSPTASAGSTRNPSATATPTGSGTVAPTAIPTTFVCTEETADKCAPGVVCSKPKVNGCVDGKCVCVLPDLPAPASFVCTERTVDKCSPGVVCSAPQTNGCVDGKCVCVLPDLPSKTTAVQTTLSTVTSKPPDPVPTPPEKPKTPVVIGERKCHDASIYTGKTDIWKSSVYDASLRACTECETPMKADSETRRRDDSWGGVRYDMSISWRSGCVSATESINCANPTKNLTMLHNTACEELFQDNWEKCTGNQGRGGYIDVGCLRYDFTPK
ncbi:Subtilisin-like protease 3 [Colletotrichum siamense]|uniref:Subtilisin-like protease 3 n=1 Tax=Colletotrichum siamense TaxID=690259 RepID=UPI00187248CB|nr:Subtilisin-like protease 3 [Colletotrichum siamense]KAF5500243.1 Subtilisin-like protease 3 [Colletotrichum siamense]